MSSQTNSSTQDIADVIIKKIHKMREELDLLNLLLEKHFEKSEDDMENEVENEDLYDTYRKQKYEPVIVTDLE